MADTLPVITTQPQSCTTHPNGWVLLFVEATGENLQYQWFYRNASNNLVSLPDWSLTYNEWYYNQKNWILIQEKSPLYGATEITNAFCRVSNSAGYAESSAVTITLNANAPKITLQYSFQSGHLDELTTFSVAATGNGLSYQWMAENAGEIEAISGETQDTYSIIASADKNLKEYFCRVTNSAGVNYLYQKLYINPKITTQPVSVEANAGATVTFTVAATGLPIIKYQWEIITPGDRYWEEIEGATSDTLSLTANSSYNGKYIRCKIISDYEGVSENSQKVYSDFVTLTVIDSSLVITAQPQNLTVAAGATATFSISVTGTAPIGYQWQKSTDGTTFANITGATSTAYSFSASEDDNGTKYRCVVTNTSGQATSSAATLTISSSPSPDPGPEPEPEPTPTPTPGDNLCLTASPKDTFVGETITLHVSGLQNGEFYAYGIYRGEAKVAGIAPDDEPYEELTSDAIITCGSSWLSGAESILTAKAYIYSGGVRTEILTDMFRISSDSFVIPFGMDPEVAALPVSGWLPRDTKRNNLYRLMFASGVNIVKDGAGDPYFTFFYPASENPTEIPDAEIYVSGSERYEKPYSRVSVTEHAYTALLDQNPATLFDNSDGDAVVNAEIWFTNAPVIVSTLEATEGLSVVWASENSAIVTGTGKLTGIPYTHTTRMIEHAVAGGDSEKTKKVDNCTMVNAANSANLLARLRAFYQPDGLIRTIKNSIVYSDQQAGKAYGFSGPFDDETVAWLTSMSINASEVFKAVCEWRANYEPAGQAGLYTHCIVLHPWDDPYEENDHHTGSWTVPEDVTSFKAVLIGAGTGGGSGWPGKNGKDAEAYTQSLGDSPAPWYGAEGGDGGAGGTGGQPGKVKTILFDNVTPGASFSYSLGYGGAGGAATGYIPDTVDELREALMSDDWGTEYTDEEIEEMIAEYENTGWAGAPNPGSAGTATTFSDGNTTWSTEDGDAYRPTAGVYDPIHGNWYALPGKAGIPGGKGGARKVEQNGYFTWVTNGEDVTGPDGTVYHGGATGEPLTEISGLPEANVIAYGGNGAGAAVGIDHDTHPHIDGGSDAWAQWWITEGE